MWRIYPQPRIAVAMRHKLFRIIMSISAAVMLMPSISRADAIPVELRQTGTKQGWQLLRGGEPYFIRGAGGNSALQQLVAAGGNSHGQL